MHFRIIVILAEGGRLSPLYPTHELNENNQWLYPGNKSTYSTLIQTLLYFIALILPYTSIIKYFIVVEGFSKSY